MIGVDAHGVFFCKTAPLYHLPFMIHKHLVILGQPEPEIKAADGLKERHHAQRFTDGTM
jgi:hypothetical protein